MSRHWTRTIRFSKKDFAKVVKQISQFEDQFIRYEFDRREGTLRIKTKDGVDLSSFDVFDQKEAEKDEADRILKIQIRPFDVSGIPDFKAAHAKALFLFADKVAVGSFECDHHLTLIFKDVQTRIDFFKAIKEHTPFLNIKPPISSEEKMRIGEDEPTDQGDSASL